MKKLLLSTIAIGLGACSASGGEFLEGEPPGVGAAPGNAASAGSPTSEDDDTAVNSGAAAVPAVRGDAADDAALTAERQVPREPDGVVLDDGTVVMEGQGTGLVPKASIVAKRLVGSSSTRSTLTLDGVTPTSHICGLTMVWGTLYGTGSQVLVTTNSTNWFLTTFPLGNPDRVALETICYPTSAFSDTEAGWQILTPSPEFSVRMTGTGFRTTDMWKSDAAAILTGVGGRFSGDGEFARTVLSTNTQTLASLQLSTLQGDSHLVWGRSFFVGVPGGNHVPQFVGPRGTGSLSTAGQFGVTFDAGSTFNDFASIVMTPITNAFCFLTNVTGHWGNKDSFVQISTVMVGGVTFWKLHASATGSNQVSASAACYLLQQ